MFSRLRKFFWPGANAAWWLLILPYAALVVFAGTAFAIGGAGWEYTNSSEFCGTTCHTMPPEYLSYLESPHANVKCVECHIGRATIATQFFRKAQDITHVIEFVGADYDVPIYSKKLRPASQVCEKCHNPAKFSDNSLTTIPRYDASANNKLEEIHLSFKVGGGTHREGLGKGIHWHIENDVKYIATDNQNLQQEIPWVQVTYADTGITETFVDTETDLPDDFVVQNAEYIRTVDCMTCHNRIAHKFGTPSDELDDAMARGAISPNIPYYKQNALAVMERRYPNMGEASAAIRGLRGYYEANWTDYYAANEEKIDSAIFETLSMYNRMVFPTMHVAWDTHPNNLGHTNSAGCFRCHDGNHVNEAGDTIRIECNLCHTIPVKTPADGSAPVLTLTEPYEPESHQDTNWISRHRFEFNETCEGCHDVSDPGGTSDTSFCSNSACHATEWKYADLDAAGIVELTNILPETLPTYPEVDLTWDDLIAPIFDARCVPCHGGTAGLYLDTYESAMAGGNLGPAIVPGDAESSLLVQLQEEGHPNSLAPRELEWVKQWINEGAPKS